MHATLFAPRSAPLRSSRLMRILGALATTWIIGANLGCGCGGLSDPDWSWGCLVQGDVDGAPAEATAEVADGSTVVRLAAAGDTHGAVITLAGSTLEALPLGELPASADVTVASCVEDACAPIEDVVLEVVDLGDGTARASFTGTTRDTDGLVRPVEGSFVFLRGVPSNGI